MNLYSLFLKNFDKKKFIVFGEEVLTYENFKDEVEKLSYKLNHYKNKKIAIISKNQKIIGNLLLVTAKLGSTLITINENASNFQINAQLKLTKPDLIICSDKKKIKKLKFSKQKITIDQIQNLKNVINKVQKKNTDKDYIITFSSGTTSDPKAVVFSQNIKFKRFMHIKELYEITAKDNILSVSPLDHSLGQRLFFLSILNGISFIYKEKYNFNEIKKTVKKFNITFAILPSNYLFLLKNKIKNKKIFIKKIVSGASALSVNDKKDLIKTGVKFYEMYGASEIGTVTSFKLKKNKLISVGKVLKNMSIKIVDEKNNFLKRGDIGEILCKSPLRFKYYYNNKNLTDRAFFKNYFRTGDLGKLDKDDYLYFISRKQDLIISSGKNIFPSDIEKELLKINYIKEAAVIGLKDKFFGEVVFAVCVPTSKINNIEEKIRKILSEKLSTYQLPLAYDFIKELPKNRLGKIEKKFLREKYNNLKLDLTKNLRKLLN